MESSQSTAADGQVLLTNLFSDSNDSEKLTCFDYDVCVFNFTPCMKLHTHYRYNDVSAAWVLTSAIIVFFMKAGFLLIELAFAQNVREKRHIVVVKHLDAFASAFGFFLLGFDYISRYTSPQKIQTLGFQISDPVLFFFKFTFASNTATILGGCLVTNKYKLRLPAAFLSAFVISGLIHPAIARLIWTDKTPSLSIYRFCNQQKHISCGGESSFADRLYVLDFGGGGAVHLLGGVAGLILCLFAKLHNFLENRNQRQAGRESTIINRQENEQLIVREQADAILKRDFWEWMYPVDGGGETTSEAALGVLILWFCWFAFNCGSTESVESNLTGGNSIPYHAIPSIIAVNMILAVASGGVLSVLIASWAQIRSQSDSVNANEIANGILSSLVAISAGCPFVEYWAACIIGAIAVVVYHFGCWLEYKLGIPDTARVVPVHGLCGLWSMIAVGLFLVGTSAECNFHVTFEGVCFCRLKIPTLSFGERLASQIIGSLIMIGVTMIGCFIMYGILYLLPMKAQMSSSSTFAKWYNKTMSRIFLFVFNRETVNFEGNWLFTGPGEIPHPDDRILRDIIDHHDTTDSEPEGFRRARVLSVRHYGAINRETLGTLATEPSSNYTRTGSSSAICSGRLFTSSTIEEEHQDNV